MKGALDWLLRDRRTGRWMIAQFPNTALWVFFAATVVGWFVDRESTIGRVASLIATLALGWWASAELWSGVNPFRRMLGVAGAVFVSMRLITSLSG